MGGEKGNMSMNWDKHELFICLAFFMIIDTEGKPLPYRHSNLF